MGPGGSLTGEGLDLRPHPHIDLLAITSLFSGSLDHADPLGVHKTSIQGDITPTTAGFRIVHSERTGATVREKPRFERERGASSSFPVTAKSAPHFPTKSDLPISHICKDVLYIFAAN